MPRTESEAIGSSAGFAETPPTPQVFRSALGLFPTGVAVIATKVDDELHAMTANAVSSVFE
jgi:flavin reductase (DIM6/NTAB) family NADH-FMN oxidoreductase RutF